MTGQLLQRIGIEHPIVQAPMASATTVDLVVAVSEAGGLGSLACAILGPDEIRQEVAAIRSRTSRPFNLNFFCHEPASRDQAIEARWHERLAVYREELGADSEGPAVTPLEPFGESTCRVVEEVAPPVVSFHFGLPEQGLLARVNDAGCLVMSSATTVAEAVALEQQGCDVIIAQGLEAGGHRGMFLTDDPAGQVGTMALVPQVVDAVAVPVVAAGGIGDARGIVAAFALGASAVQIGTAYLQCPESAISPLYRSQLAAARDDSTTLTNVFTGRPARALANRATRELGPIAEDVPAFPLPTGEMALLRGHAEPGGSPDFSSFWAGQAAALGRVEPAADLTRRLAAESRALAERLGP